MRCNVATVLILAVAAGTTEARAQADRGGEAPRAKTRPGANPAPATRPAAAPAPVQDPGGVRMKKLLELWERKSTDLRTLDVKIERIDRSPAWGDELFEGRALLKSPNLAWLQFTKVHIDKAGKKVKAPDAEERIICTGSEVWHYRIPNRQVFIYPLGKDQRQRALDEGPLPFLFNMKAAEAEKRYHMRLYNETKDSFVIQVVPLLDVDKESFRWALVQLSWVKQQDKDYLLPIRIVLAGPDGKSTKDYQFPPAGLVPNAQVMDTNFQGFIPPKDRQGRQLWTVHRMKENDLQPPRVGNAPAAPQPGGPAPRGRRVLNRPQ